MASASEQIDLIARRRRRVRRSAILFGLIAAAFYIGFIVMSVIRAGS